MKGKNKKHKNPSHAGPISFSFSLSGNPMGENGRTCGGSSQLGRTRRHWDGWKDKTCGGQPGRRPDSRGIAAADEVAMHSASAWLVVPCEHRNSTVTSTGGSGAQT